MLPSPTTDALHFLLWWGNSEAREQQLACVVVNCGLHKCNCCSLKREGRWGGCESTVMWLCILTTAASLKLPKRVCVVITFIFWHQSVISPKRIEGHVHNLQTCLQSVTFKSDLTFFFKKLKNWFESVTFSWVHPCSGKMEVLPTISSHTMSEPNPQLTLISEIKYWCELPDTSTLKHAPKPNREPKLIRIIWISFVCGVAFTGRPLDGCIIFSVSAAFSVRPCLINSTGYLADLWKERNTPHKAH